MTETANLLRRQQEASARVEKWMIETMLGFTPTQDLRVSDVKYIALMARTFAFDAMKEVEEQSK